MTSDGYFPKYLYGVGHSRQHLLKDLDQPFTGGITLGTNMSRWLTIYKNEYDSLNILDFLRDYMLIRMRALTTKINCPYSSLDSIKKQVTDSW